MKNIKRILLITSVLLTQSVFAATGTVVNTGTTSTGTNSASLEVPTAPRLVSKTSTGVTLEWDKVSAAAAYIVKYGKTSVAKSNDPTIQYESETDQTTSTGTTITGLESNTTYYFSIVAVDTEGNESNTFSSELGDVKTDSLGTTSTGTTVSTGVTLSLSTIDIIDNKTLSLTFSLPLSADPIQVKITKTSDNSDVPVETVTIDPTSSTKAIVKVASVIDASSNYSLSVISAKDTSGNSIMAGVDGIKEFTTPATIALSPDLNAAGTGVTASGAIDAKVLPATGTQENIIIVTALILSLGLIYFFRRKLVK